jgi:hypothetical protein
MTNCASTCAMHQKLQNITEFNVLNFMFQKTAVLKMLPYHHKSDPTKVMYRQKRNDVAARDTK